MKKQKSILKILLIILIAIILIFISTQVLATGAFSPAKIHSKESAIPTGSLKIVGNAIIKILRIIGIVSSVIVLIIIGIKYMLGSVEEKAEYKKTLIPYIIGAALVFATSAFVTVIYNWFTNL